MYENYFGLDKAPFRITPDPEFFFSGSNRGAVLEALLSAVARGEGIVKVVGEVGSGKTMLCRMLERELPGGCEIIYLANPRLSPDEILHAIAIELKLQVAHRASKIEVMRLLHAYLLEKHANNRSVVMFIEEAQGMELETLEEIRMLSNLETTQEKLLQIVLFGQPELDDKLRLHEIRQLKERIVDLH
jgi:MSHA biogenesis protein MshM